MLQSFMFFYHKFNSKKIMLHSTVKLLTRRTLSTRSAADCIARIALAIMEEAAVAAALNAATAATAAVAAAAAAAAAATAQQQWR